MSRLINFVLWLYLSVMFAKVYSEFTAAVVEFYPEQNTDLAPEERLKRNVDGYLKLLQEVGQNQKLDLIVFPEATLATNAVVNVREDMLPYTVEIPSRATSLCSQTTATFLRSLACAAVQHKTYMAINLYERAVCKQNATTACANDGWDFYNTNVVLNRNGAVVSKYRKYNLFGEYFMNRTATPDISIFDTDFGARFASFICFDILFRKPTLDLVTEHNVTHIIYSSMWFSELPFLTALQTQQQWAYAVNATLLASGANNPKLGSGGTGIYQGVEGPLIFDVLGNSVSKALVAKLPKDSVTAVHKRDTGDIDKKAKEMDGFHLKYDNLKLYTSRLIFSGNNEINETVCSEDNGRRLCCDFEILLEWDSTTRDVKNHYQYHMVAYTGVRSFTGVYNGGIEICGVIACIGKTLDSCGKRFRNYDTISWPATFRKITIKAEFDVDDNKYQYPNSLLSDIKPIHVDAIEWNSMYVDNVIRRTYTLKEPQNRLMTFAIYGRDFNRDKSKSSDSSNSSSVMSIEFSCIVLLVYLNVYIR